MTGLGCEIGYPNPHLGKCKDETIKSPMYATGIGLVLAGFKQLDAREVIDQQEENDSAMTLSEDLSSKDKASSMFTSITKRLGGTLNLKDLIVDKDLEDGSEY